METKNLTIQEFYLKLKQELDKEYFISQDKFKEFQSSYWEGILDGIDNAGQIVDRIYEDIKEKP